MNKVVERPKKYSLVERTPAATFEEERLHRKQRLAATFRLFSRYGYDQGLAGHVTVRDPEFPERFWINPLSKHFSQIKVSDLQLVDHEGNILIGDKPINQAGFVIHSAIHAAHPEVIAAAHTHSTYGKAWSALGRLLDPLTHMKIRETTCLRPPIFRTSLQINTERQSMVAATCGSTSWCSN
ncbi:class II aldolase/adducin family protein [Bradyrhizobium sp. CCBAU 45389]|uniref:class II aldolase/adducin family protein n=1 Tax=Bradyrhizobium sp. CCBAU 45389 TaxID=858429 RepID=UPI0023051E45|nr:class II aldolase/adducin family protein [Bradyrhizobium sp. CCBAU 45389]